MQEYEFTEYCNQFIEIHKEHENDIRISAIAKRNIWTKNYYAALQGCYR